MTDIKRDALIARIHKLSALASCAGATEAEAFAAGEKMRQLIAEFAVTRDELALRRDAKGCVADFLYIVQQDKADWQRIHGVIGRLFGVKSFRRRSKEDVLGIGLEEWVISIHFFGFPEDVAAAKGFMHIMEQQCIAEIAKWNKIAKQRKNRADFELGLFTHLRDRIEGLIPPPMLSQGRGLIVLKDQLVTDEYGKWLADQGVALSVRGLCIDHQIDANAFASGTAAANRVDLQQTKVRPMHTAIR